MIRHATAHNGKVIGTSIDATLAVVGALPVLSDEGFFRVAYTANGVVYKVARIASDNDDNYREWSFMRDLAHCRCGIARYATPTTLWDINGVYIIAQPMYSGFVTRERTRAMARIVRNHNAHGHEPIIADLRDGNYHADDNGNLHITDGNLDVRNYPWLIETETTGCLEL